MAESVPVGCSWVQSPAGQRQIPRGAGQSRQATWQTAVRSQFCFGGKYSPALYSLWFFGWGRWPENQSWGGRGVMAGPSAGCAAGPPPPRPWDAGAEEALV